MDELPFFLRRQASSRILEGPRPPALEAERGEGFSREVLFERIKALQLLTTLLYKSKLFLREDSKNFLYCSI